MSKNMQMKKETGKISHRKEYSERNNRKTCYNGGIGKIRNRK